MVLSLARNGVLAANRGDLILFSNTTAEHPATYDFARRVCEEIETEHGVPCLWYEFCTYETASGKGWARRAGYRLVRKTRASIDDDPAVPGYRIDGSAFEALASLRAMLPNRSLRFCTQALKVQPGIELLAEWFSGGPGPRHLGHYHREPQTSAAESAGRYRGSSMRRDEFEQVSSFAHSQPPQRPEQRWIDFTPNAGDRADAGQRAAADLAGRNGRPFRYLTLLGLRGDEPDRVSRVMFEAMLADGATGSRCRHDSHPAGEVIACPLFDSNASKDDVDDFWSRQPYDLGIDSKWGNCVYCPMKGEAALRRLAHHEAVNGQVDSSSPSSIAWWSDIERRYGRASESEGVESFRFLSLRSPTFAEIAASPNPPANTKNDTMPCMCAD